MSQYLAQVRFEDGGRLLQLIGQTGQVLQLADGLLRLSHVERRPPDVKLA